MRPRLPLCLLAAALMTGSATAAQVSPDVEIRLAADGAVDVLVFFHDEEEPAPRAMESTATLIPRLKRNMDRSLDALGAGLGLGESELDELWISNAVALRVDAERLAALRALPAVKRIDWDEPVAAPQVDFEPAGEPTESNWTYGLEALGIPEVREQHGLTGAGVVVGHLDTGIDPDHPSLVGRLKRYKNFRGWGSAPKDSDGHGTHTAGTIAGNDASGKQIGVAPNARLIVGRAIGFSFSGPTKGLLKGMQWMLDPDGKPATRDAPRVVSMSWHSGSGNQNPFYEALKTYEGAGIIPSFSAGNSGTGGITHPKEYPGNFVTAAVNSAGTVAGFSSRGPTTYKGRTIKKPDWAAPGVAVYSAKPGGGYQKASGTSMACPHVSGVIALMLEADPSLTPSEVRGILAQTAEDKGPTGWDGAYGRGTINALGAIQAVLANRESKLADLAPWDRELSAQRFVERMDLFSELLD